MYYFIFRLQWSQTDSDYTIVRAATEHQAREKIAGNARSITCYGKTDKIL